VTNIGQEFDMIGVLKDIHDDEIANIQVMLTPQ
jgi:hypothetical protein